MAKPTAPGSEIRYHAPYMEWAKTRAAAEFDLAGSNIMACALGDLPGARDAVDLAGANDNGYRPLVDAVGVRYGVNPDLVTTAGGTSGANFLVLAALLEPGDDVLVERPGYDPLLGAARLFGARTVRFDRSFTSGFALDPDRVRHAMTPRTKVIVITSPHNPTGVAADPAALDEIGTIAERAGAHVVVDEVYKDVTEDRTPPAAARGDVFVTTSSLTKSYGLSSLRAGWVIASPSLSYRVRRARDVVDGTGSIVAERPGDARLSAARRPRGARPRHPGAKQGAGERLPAVAHRAGMDPLGRDDRLPAPPRSGRLATVRGTPDARAQDRARSGILLRSARAFPARLRWRHRQDSPGAHQRSCGARRSCDVTLSSSPDLLPSCKSSFRRNPAR